MASPSPGARPEEGRKGVRAQRLKVALIVFTIFGLPLALMLAYLALRESFEPPFGDQPGGTVRGRTVDGSGAPLPGVRIEVFTEPRTGDPQLLRQLASGEDGRFESEVPPLDGCYALRVGGGPWVETVHDLSLVDDPFPDLEFELRPGSELSVALGRADGGQVSGGHYYLTRAGGPLGLPIPSDALTGGFAGANFARGGLRPGVWTLGVELADGTKAEWRLNLTGGPVEYALEL
jgi:hypothetical protein